MSSFSSNLGALLLGIGLSTSSMANGVDYKESERMFKGYLGGNEVVEKKEPTSCELLLDGKHEAYCNVFPGGFVQYPDHSIVPGRNLVVDFGGKGKYKIPFGQKRICSDPQHDLALVWHGKELGIDHFKPKLDNIAVSNNFMIGDKSYEVRQIVLSGIITKAGRTSPVMYSHEKLKVGQSGSSAISIETGNLVGFAVATFNPSGPGVFMQSKEFKRSALKCLEESNWEDL